MTSSHPLNPPLQRYSARELSQNTPSSLSSPRVFASQNICCGRFFCRLDQQRNVLTTFVQQAHTSDPQNISSQIKTTACAMFHNFVGRETRSKIFLLQRTLISFTPSKKIPTVTRASLSSEIYSRETQVRKWECDVLFTQHNQPSQPEPS